MLTSNFSVSTIGWISIATGVAGLLGLLFIILFFTMGQPFGTLNDISIGLAAVLSGILAWSLNSKYFPQLSLLGRISLLLAMIGMVLVLVGSYRAACAISGWYLSGLYMAAGNALIGLWLFYFNSNVLHHAAMSPSLAIFGLVSGGFLLLGLVTIPGIIRGIDLKTYDVTAVNVIWWSSALGWLLVYPSWCLWLGSSLLE